MFLPERVFVEEGNSKSLRTVGGILYAKVVFTAEAIIDHALKDEFILYVQEVVTLQKKYLKYVHKKMRFTPVINEYDTLG